MATEKNQILRHGESSRLGEVRYVPKQSFQKAFAELLKTPKDGAFYTEGVESRAQYYRYDPNRHKQLFFSEDVDNMSFSQYMQLERDGAAKKQRVGVESDTKYAARINFINTVERTAEQIARKFRDYKIFTVTVYHTQPDGPSNGVSTMHADYSEGITDMLVVVAALLGQSTIYKSADAKAEIIVPDQSLVGHTGFAQHRSPVVPYGTSRMALVIELKKKK